MPVVHVTEVHGRVLVIGLDDESLQSHEARVAETRGVVFCQPQAVTRTWHIPEGTGLVLLVVDFSDPASEATIRRIRHLARQRKALCAAVMNPEDALKTLALRVRTRHETERETDGLGPGHRFSLQGPQRRPGVSPAKYRSYEEFVDERIPAGYRFNPKLVAARIRQEAREHPDFLDLQNYRIIARVAKIRRNRLVAAGFNPNTYKPGDKVPAAKPPDDPELN